MPSRAYFPTKFWQNVFFWFGSLVFSFLPLILAVSPENFPFGGLSFTYVFDTKYPDVLTILFVFVCIAFFDLIDVSLSLRHDDLLRVVAVVLAIILLLGSFAMVVVSHTHEAANKVVSVISVQPTTGPSEPADNHSQQPSLSGAPQGKVTEIIEGPLSKFSPSADKRGPGKIPKLALFAMFAVAAACKIWQALLDWQSERGVPQGT